MYRYKAHEWKSTTSDVEIFTTGKDALDIRCSCVGPVQISGVNSDGQIVPLFTQEGTFRFRAIVQGFDKVFLSSLEGDLFGYCVNAKARQVEEPHDDLRAPEVPTFGATDNLLLQLRQRARDEARLGRDPVLERDFEFNPLQADPLLDPEGEPVFEEEEAAFRKKMQQKRVAAKKARPAELLSSSQHKPVSTPEETKLSDSTEGTRAEPAGEAS